MAITTDDTTYYQPPAWLDADAILPDDVRSAIDDIGAERTALFPAVRAWAEKARELGWRVHELIDEQVRATEMAFDLDLGDVSLHMFLSTVTGWEPIECAANMLASHLDVVGRARPAPMTEAQIAGLAALKAEEAQP